MSVKVFDKKSRAKAYCKKKNKKVWKYAYNYQKKVKGGWYVYKYR